MTLVSSVISLPLLTACSQSSEDVDETPVVENALIKNHDGTETLILSTGEQIVLEDTVTYLIDFTKLKEPKVPMEGSVSGIESRAIFPTGYDRAVIQKDNKKYLLKGLEAYGVSETMVYIGKFNTYEKDISVPTGYVIVADDETCKDKRCMGFNPPTTQIGFNLVSSSMSGYKTGITQIFYIVSDISGVAWNKNVPCNPQNLVWCYVSYKKS